MTPLYTALTRLLRNPRENYKKIFPYLRAHFSFIIRPVVEVFGIEHYSKPYPAHKSLLRHITTTNGIFVVCGGNDGYSYDPTYYLERFRGWKGLIIEPLPKAAALCKKNRPASIIKQVALVSHDYKKDTILLTDCNFMSITTTTTYQTSTWVAAGERTQSIKATEILVSAKTLDACLSEEQIQPNFDLLVIDVEGSEAEVLRGLDLEKFIPKQILIELHTPELQKTVEKIFAGRYKLKEKIDTADYLYILQ